jgi:AcrR family transcriptional regulator
MKTDKTKRIRIFLFFIGVHLRSSAAQKSSSTGRLKSLAGSTNPLDNRPSRRYASNVVEHKAARRQDGGLLRDSQRTVAVILEAAERVIVHSGLEKATIDEVAREAGVSKGGVLHHFPSKEAIIVGLLESLIEKFEADVLARQALDPEPKGSFTRAFLNAVTEKNDHCIEVSFALKAGFRNCPALQELVRSANVRWQDRIEQDGIDPVCASVVRLATEGLWLAKLHRVTVPSEKYRGALMKHLAALTRTPVVRKQTVRTTRQFASH